jgi:periplasmic protein TonB
VHLLIAKMTKAQKVSRVFEALTDEIHHRPIVGLLAVLVLLLHLWLGVFLMRPSASDDAVKPPKIMVVALLSEPSPKAEAAPPAPPKQVPPKKQAVKPPVKKKVPIVPKKLERPTPIAEKPAPVLPSASNPVSKPETSASSATTAANKSTKIGAGDAQNKAASSGVVALVRVKPNYPARAASRHIEGWVKIEFTVNPSGSVANARVIGASPPGIFDEAALDAIKKWKFKPKIVNGNAVVQRAVQTLKFTLLK